MNIAVIPARGGSKRILRKNIKPFAGKPMIAHAIGAASASELFEHIVVSTDDEEIAQVARDCGAETPFMRPADLADDHTPTVPVISHTISACEALGWKIDRVCCIYPCVPFLRPVDLSNALKIFCSSQTDYCFPVTEFPSAIQRALKRNNDGKLSPFYPENEASRTQDLEPAYHDAGLFYWGARDAWLNNPSIHSSSIGVVMPNWCVVDIDTPNDWSRAEMIRHAFAKPLPNGYEEEIGI